jgi:DnaJ domain
MHGKVKNRAESGQRHNLIYCHQFRREVSLEPNPSIFVTHQEPASSDASSKRIYANISIFSKRRQRMKMAWISCGLKSRCVQQIFSKSCNRYQTQRNYVIPVLNVLNWRSLGASSSSNSQYSSTRCFRGSAVASKKKSYYDVLGVSKTASKEEIKASYRELAKKCHPDLNRDDKNAEEKFREITSAYEVLENDGKRQTYDRHGVDGLEVRHSLQSVETETTAALLIC